MVAIYVSYALLLFSTPDTCKFQLYNKVFEDTTFERSFFISVQVELPDKSKHRIVTTNYFFYNYFKTKMNFDHKAYKEFVINKIANNLPINIKDTSAFFHLIVDPNKKQSQKIIKKGKNYFLRNFVAKNNGILFKKLNDLNEFEVYAILWELNVGVRWGSDEAIPYIDFVCK